MTNTNLLIIEAHSDDSAISSTAFINKLYNEGYTPHFYLAAVSSMKLHHSGHLTRKQRMNEYKNFVNSMNGIWEYEKFKPIDAESKLDTIPKADIVAEIEKIISDVRPKKLILQGPSFHHDHTIVYESAIAATRPTARFVPDEIYIMENPTYVHSLGPSTDFKPNFYVTMNEKEINNKLSIFKNNFPTQIRETGNCLSPEGIKSWARYRGIEARAEYAEAYVLYRLITKSN